MSTFLQLLKGAAKSNTVQINGILLAIWAAVMNSEKTMKRHPIARILFLFATVSIFFAAPFVLSNTSDVIPILVKPESVRPFDASTAPAGVFLPIAGQDVASGGIVLRAQDEAEIGELVLV